MKPVDLYLVTGATGLLGRAVVRRLCRTGRPIRALVLPGDPAANLPPEAEIFHGRVDDESSMDAFFSGDLSNACLIHCAGIVSIASDPGEELWRVNVGGTRNVLRKCLFHGMGRAVFVSSVHAIPEPAEIRTIREPASFSAERVFGAYAKSKAEAARLVRSAAADGADLRIVLPSGIIDPYGERGNVAAVIRSFCNRRLPFAVRGGYDFVDVRDAAEGIVACCENGRAGECYLLTGRYATLSEIFGHLSRLGYGREPICLPLSLARRLAPLAERGEAALGRPLFLTPDSVRALESRARFSHEKAAAELGYAPRLLEITLDDAVSRMVGHGLIPPIRIRPS